MCGIVGLVNIQKIWTELMLQSLNEALAHRGPDGQGTFVREPVALGHRRLSIIDLDAGAQPIFNEDGLVGITYNGELYNYRELRQVLQAAGHTFQTASDTEVIVHAWEEWGEACVKRFRGMFAFAIADWRQQKLFLARDPLGIKPLYYLSTPECFAFASEIQALRKIPGVKLELDLSALDEYLWLQYISAPKTVFKQIKKLSPGHTLLVSFDGDMQPPKSYWNLHFAPDHTKKGADWLAELELVLQESVTAHLVADVPFGAFLSGGVDSSLVVTYMAQVLDQPVKTFSIGFKEQSYSELQYAQLVADRWNTEHYTAVVEPENLGEMLPKLVAHYGEPFGDSSALPTYYVSKLARQYVPMVLSGDGGDELFAGYTRYQSLSRWLAYGQVPGWKRATYPALARIFPGRYSARKMSLQKWMSMVQYLDVDQRRALWRPEYQAALVYNVEIFDQIYQQAQGLGPTQTAQLLDIHTYLPFDILTKVDIASMMHGLEVRTPFVDIRVAEFAATIPPTLLLGLRNGLWEGKLLLKKLLLKYFSEGFVDRPKQGFAVPLEKWFMSSGALEETLRDNLLASTSPLHEYFKPGMISAMIQRNTSGPLWLLVFLNEWLIQYNQQN